MREGRRRRTERDVQRTERGTRTTHTDATDGDTARDILAIIDTHTVKYITRASIGKRVGLGYTTKRDN